MKTRQSAKRARHEENEQGDASRPALTASNQFVDPQLGDDNPTDLAQAGSQSDDEGPEEVSLSTARAQIQEANALQKANQALARGSNKVQRKSKQRITEKPEDTDDTRQQAGSTEMGDLDLLPDDVIQALQKEKRLKSSKSHSSAEAMSPHQNAKSAAPASNNEMQRERQAGPVTVKILDERPRSFPSVAAREYASQRLHGSRLLRSLEMIRPVRKSHFRRQQAWLRVKN